MIVCLMPTYNRMPEAKWLVDEAVECFLRQTYLNSELVILNDTPDQRLVFSHPRVRVYNVDQRFTYLSDKIQFMIDVSPHATHFARWDDDDLSLPHRLEYSLNKLNARGSLEWTANNYWFSGHGLIKESVGPVNVHVMSIWHRDLLDLCPDGKYPQKRKGDEDLCMNHILRETKQPRPERIPTHEMYYVYRWGVSRTHLSSRKDMGAYYDARGKEKQAKGEYRITPAVREEFLTKFFKK